MLSKFEPIRVEQDIIDLIRVHLFNSGLTALVDSNHVQQGLLNIISMETK